MQNDPIFNEIKKTFLYAELELWASLDKEVVLAFLDCLIINDGENDQLNALIKKIGNDKSSAALTIIMRCELGVRSKFVSDKVKARTLIRDILAECDFVELQF